MDCYGPVIFAPRWRPLLIIIKLNTLVHWNDRQSISWFPLMLFQSARALIFFESGFKKILPYFTAYDHYDNNGGFWPNKDVFYYTQPASANMIFPRNILEIVQITMILSVSFRKSWSCHATIESLMKVTILQSQQIFYKWNRLYPYNSIVIQHFGERHTWLV